MAVMESLAAMVAFQARHLAVMVVGYYFPTAMRVSSMPATPPRKRHVRGESYRKIRACIQKRAVRYGHFTPENGHSLRGRNVR